MVVDAVVRRYRSGGCFAMAEALHQLTGHPVRCIDFAGCVHAFVLTPAHEVIDIHGKQTWVAFLAFLVAEGNVPAKAVADGLVMAREIPEDPPILWRHLGYRKPSLQAVREAKAAAKSHPNTAMAVAR